MWDCWTDPIKTLSYCWFEMHEKDFNLNFQADSHSGEAWSIVRENSAAFKLVWFTSGAKHLPRRFPIDSIGLSREYWEVPSRELKGLSTTGLNKTFTGVWFRHYKKQDVFRRRDCELRGFSKVCKEGEVAFVWDRVSRGVLGNGFKREVWSYEIRTRKLPAESRQGYKRGGYRRRVEPQKKRKTLEIWEISFDLKGSEVSPKRFKSWS